MVYRVLMDGYHNKVSNAIQQLSISNLLVSAEYSWIAYTNSSVGIVVIVRSTQSAYKVVNSRHLNQ